MSGMNVCVLGAGVVGLNTALQLQNEFRNATVTILADKFHKDTTSFIAAGLFLPSESFSGPTLDVTREWVNYSYHHWNDIFTTYGGREVGIMEISGYLYSTQGPEFVQNHYVEKLLPIYRRATNEELDLCPGGWKYGSFMTTLVIENGIYLPWATNKFLSKGGKIISHKLEEISELAGKYDVVVNCSGLGSKFLFNDHTLVPVRGQILKVRSPIDKFYLTDWDTYVIPGFEGVTLGGTRNFENYNLNWNKYDELDITEKCESLVPQLRGCPVIAKRVGLRPYRNPVRLESEIINFYQNKIKIVHNYGHGGYGVTTSPGTAKHAVKLVRELLSTSSKL